MELLKTKNTVIYDTRFFDRNSQIAMRSARPAAALVYEMLRPAAWSTLDVDSANGCWPFRS